MTPAHDPPPAAPAGPGRWPRAVLGLVLALATVAVLSTYRDYGATWDEGLQARYGELALDYFRSGGTDKASTSFEDLRVYGPLFEMLPALFYDRDAASKYEVRHLFLGLLAVLGLPALWLVGRRLGAPAVGGFALLGLATLPRYYGHWFHNSKDLTFAVLTLWYIAALVWLFATERLRWTRAAVVGLALGFGLCGRPGGLPLFALFAFAIAAPWLAAQSRGITAALRDLLPKMAVGLALGWVLMVLPWPWAHEAPLGNPVRAMREAAAFSTTVPVLFDGETIPSDRLPRRYLLHYLAVGTPLPLLALAGFGLLAALCRLLRTWRTAEGRTLGLVLVWLAGPLLLFVVLRPNIYGGMRHFLFVLPAVCLLAGLGAHALVRTLAPRRGAGLATGACAVLLALPVVDLWRLHPYQMTYYNAAVGGVRGASDGYWTDYWLSSYREAIAWVAAQPRPDGAPTPAVIGAGPSVMRWATAYAGDAVQLTPLARARRAPGAGLPAGQYYIGTTRNRLDQHYPDAEVVHTIGRDGATFTVIKRGR